MTETLIRNLTKTYSTGTVVALQTGRGGTIKAKAKPNYDKLVEVSVIDATIQKGPGG